MTKTIHCRWETDLFYNSMGLCGNFTKTSTEVHILYEFLLTFWDVVQTLIPPFGLHLGRPQPPFERKLLNLQYARYQSLSK